MAEWGNPTGGILLSLRRMSTVKIRAGSLFHNVNCRLRAVEALFAQDSGQSGRIPAQAPVWEPAGFPRFSTPFTAPSQTVHSSLRLPLA